MTELTYPTDLDELVTVCHRLAESGLVIGTAGNVSRRIGDHVLITATGAVLADISTADITVVDLDGRVLEGTLAPTSELELHLGVYRRFDARAVVHTHAPRSTAVACAVEKLPVIHYQQLLLGGATPVVPFAAFGTQELADGVVEALTGRQAALLAGHGAVTIGQTLHQAVENSLLLEWACGVFIDSAALGGAWVLTTDEQAAVIEAATRRSYGTTKTIEQEQ
ncbi:L-fuculose phosphate aldolase [Gordonia effusa NBRC 100432]|uniref:L-fuculose phosphate aldolase n=1 Tax=Gordonia effusa NBRC 100432 TaxID=1077974 RepID=H0R6J4_9ACTN|nr:class II aldolase/adducin family protein [Gordonia effusa]GAB20695.1 L-fuculose phosphate aldolase [Gordonia effusa NBRC 100432]